MQLSFGKWSRRSSSNGISMFEKLEIVGWWKSWTMEEKVCGKNEGKDERRSRRRKKWKEGTTACQLADFEASGLLTTSDPRGCGSIARSDESRVDGNTRRRGWKSVEHQRRQREYGELKTRGEKKLLSDEYSSLRLACIAPYLHRQLRSSLWPYFQPIERTTIFEGHGIIHLDSLWISRHVVHCIKTFHSSKKLHGVHFRWWKQCSTSSANKNKE